MSFPNILRKFSALALIVSLCVGIRIILLVALPTMEDEAYYALWARFPDWGYFDHPPMVAWSAYLGNFFESFAAARLGGFLLSICSLWLLWDLSVKVFPNNRVVASMAFALTVGSLLGLIHGVLLTPDTPMIFAWILALHEAHAAFQGNHKRWLCVGIAIGIGMLSKYTMVLMGPVLIATALVSNRRLFKSPWPYTAIAVSLVIFLPHLWWNAEHDWVSFRFQMRRGLANAHDIDTQSLIASKLPPAQPAPSDSPEAQLGSYFTDTSLVSIRPEKTAIEAFFARVGDFFGGQLALWGFLALLFIGRLGRKNFRPHAIPTQLVLMQAAWIVPLVFFGLISLFTKVEANWPAMYVVGAGFALAPFFADYGKAIVAAITLNGLVLILLTWHANVPFLPLKPRKDRLLRESRGYADLADYLREKKIPNLLFDSYQTGSMLTLVDHDLTLAQYPGITRMSEFLRRPALNPLTPESLEKQRGFYLLGNGQIPPAIEHFHIKNIEELRLCGNLSVTSTVSPNNKPYQPDALCASGTIRRWFLSYYAAAHEAGTEESIHEK